MSEFQCEYIHNRIHTFLGCFMEGLTQFLVKKKRVWGNVFKKSFWMFEKYFLQKVMKGWKYYIFQKYFCFSLLCFRLLCSPLPSPPLSSPFTVCGKKVLKKSLERVKKWLKKKFLKVWKIFSTKKYTLLISSPWLRNAAFTGKLLFKYLHLEQRQ